jgi:hypothetical protein
MARPLEAKKPDRSRAQPQEKPQPERAAPQERGQEHGERSGTFRTPGVDAVRVGEEALGFDYIRPRPQSDAGSSTADGFAGAAGADRKATCSLSM